MNLDLLYGLPHQTEQSIESTVRQALSLRPDRIALFGYAHVPWFKKHQTMIEEAWLPDAQQRFAQSRKASAAITEAGYQAIGIDHFALLGRQPRWLRQKDASAAISRDIRTTRAKR